jgi:hypothetical protein
MNQLLTIIIAVAALYHLKPRWRQVAGGSNISVAEAVQNSALAIFDATECAAVATRLRYVLGRHICSLDQTIVGYETGIMKSK